MTVQLLSVNDTAERLGVAVQTLRNWISLKRIPYVKVGRRTMFHPGELARWLEEHTVREQGAPPPLEVLRAGKGGRRSERRKKPPAPTPEEI